MIDLLQVEYWDRDAVIAPSSPRFSWRCDVVQRDFRLMIFSENGELFHDTGTVVSDDDSLIYSGPALQSDAEYRWKISVNGGRETAEQTFRTAPEFTAGQWVCEHPGREGQHDRVAVFRRDFDLTELPRRAYLHITALGLYRVEINGRRVGDSYLTPGWTDYFHRVPFQSYRVGELLRPGRNRIEAVLACGWYCSRIATMWLTPDETYGDTPAVRFELRGEVAGVRRVLAASDEACQVSVDGPIRKSDIYDGEEVDFTVRWHDFRPCRIAAREVAVFPTTTPAVRGVRRIAPVGIRTTSEGRCIVDFGVNIAGKEELDLTLAEGETIRVTHAEVLKEDGDVYTENLRSAVARSVFTGDGTRRRFSVEFTFFGFRYIAIDGLRSELRPEMVTALQMHTPLRETGSFRCSNELLNQLFRNIVNSQRCNYIDVPIDCPQRDERRPWLGDAQVFMPTAAYNFDVAAFLRRWLEDVDLCRNEWGEYPPYAPFHSKKKNFKAGAGWADAGIICPAELYRYYGDRRFLEAHYDAMRTYMMRQLETSDNFIRCVDIYRDWLNLGADTPPELICTAYFACDARLMSRIAEVLEKPEDAKFFASLYEDICAAYRGKFINNAGKLTVVTQTAAVLSLDFGILRGKDAERAVEMLRNDIVNHRGVHLSTGFLGTPRLLHVLAEHGQEDLAFRLLEQTSYPSWLYSVLHGATTTWERWNSWAEFDGFADSSMNSFNHYAYGAVGEFLFRYVGGIAPVWEFPGMKKVLISPHPGGTLTFAETVYDSRRGRIKVAWQREEQKIVYRISIPANVIGILDIAGMERREVESGEYEFAIQNKGGR
ncbi:MAG: glycoside hydrolase family 78 protein [Lentisphaeria bacterium]|nr:glycoside hydrolase family 78 protein [Lentisphaeria bacterium]